jgi:hypothetical protein
MPNQRLLQHLAMDPDEAARLVGAYQHALQVKSGLVRVRMDRRPSGRDSEGSRVAVGELTMPETEKTKPEKPETRPTDDGYLTPTPAKKIIEPVVSRASHFS